MIDDELVITVRVRIKPDEGRVRHINLGASISSSLLAALQEHNVPGDLAGVEIALPTFQPYPDQP